MANKEVNVGDTNEPHDELVTQQRLEDRDGGASAIVRSPINTEIQRMMMTDAAQSVLQTGYAKEMVQKAIERLLVTEGSAGMTVAKISNAIVSIQKEGERMELPSASGGAEITVNETNANEVSANETSVTANEVNSNVIETGAYANEVSVNANEAGANANEASGVQENVLAMVLKKYHELNDATLCKVCHVNKICVVFLPCSHMVTCTSCAPKLRYCLNCGSYVKATVNAYFQ